MPVEALAAWPGHTGSTLESPYYLLGQSVPAGRQLQIILEVNVQCLHRSQTWNLRFVAADREVTTWKKFKKIIGVTKNDSDYLKESQVQS